MGKASRKKQQRQTVRAEPHRMDGVRRCPACRTLHGGTVSVTLGRPPRALADGDLTICGTCGAVLIAVPVLAFRLATAPELDALGEGMRLLIGAYHEAQRTYRQAHPESVRAPASLASVQ